MMTTTIKKEMVLEPRFCRRRWLNVGEGEYRRRMSARARRGGGGGGGGGGGNLAWLGWIVIFVLFLKCCG